MLNYCLSVKHQELPLYLPLTKFFSFNSSRRSLTYRELLTPSTSAMDVAGIHGFSMQYFNASKISSSFNIFSLPIISRIYGMYYAYIRFTLHVTNNETFICNALRITYWVKDMKTKLKSSIKFEQIIIPGFEKILHRGWKFNITTTY